MQITSTLPTHAAAETPGETAAVATHAATAATVAATAGKN